jgi:hypothetical protein
MKHQPVLPKSKVGRRGMFESHERLAHRLAIYLRSVGVEPVAPAEATSRQKLTAYHQQWEALPVHVRSRGRRTGRARMSISTLTESLHTERLITTKNPSIEGDRETVAVVCPHCRMRGGFPKRAWLSRQLAEDALLRALEIPKNFEGIHVYECPYNRRYWHLGHLREDASIKALGACVGENSNFSKWVVLCGLGLISLFGCSYLWRNPNREKPTSSLMRLLIVVGASILQEMTKLGSAVPSEYGKLGKRRSCQATYSALETRIGINREPPSR